MHGTNITAAIERIQWVRRNRMLGDYLTCRVTSGNGALIGMLIATGTWLELTPLDLLPANLVFFAGAVVATAQGSVTLQVAAGSRLISGPTISVFVLFWTLFNRWSYEKTVQLKTGHKIK